MKTETDYKASVRINTAGTGQLKNLKIGMELQARIAIRHDNKDAVLEILGTRIRASFPRGVPQGENVRLRLDKMTNSSLLFKIIPRESIPSPKIIMAPHLLNSATGDGPHLRTILSKFASSGIPSIFFLNELLLKPEKKPSGNDTRGEFMRKLIEMGFGSETLRRISSMIILQSLPSQFSLPMLRLLYGGKWDRLLAAGGKTEEDLIEPILSDIRAVSNDKDRADIIRGMISIFSSPGEVYSGKNSGEIPLFFGDEYCPAGFLAGSGALLIELTLSGLGQVEIMAKDTGRSLEIRIYGDSREHVEILNKRILELDGSIQKRIKKHYSLHILPIQDIINKIVEINSQYALNSEFDIMV